MSMPDSSAAETPFAVACPGCHGALAVTNALAGSAVCCPLCACGFLVPDPRQPQPTAPPRKDRERRSRDRATSETSVGPARPAVRDLDIPSDAPVSAATLQAPPAPSAGDQAEAATAADAPAVAAAPADAASYRFREAAPVVIGSGADAIELRRLTPEEKQARRIRRNLIMLLSGSAVLIVIALIFGRSSGKRRRR
jgi:hypothetical protein